MVVVTYEGFFLRLVKSLVDLIIHTYAYMMHTWYAYMMHTWYAYMHDIYFNHWLFFTYNIDIQHTCTEGTF